MIYVDTSVVLAALFAEDRRPRRDFWAQPLWSSRLLTYETATRLHARGAADSHRAAHDALLARLHWLELSPVVLRRALAPFAPAVRTLDALHLASCLFLREHHQAVILATYDHRMAAAAAALDIPLAAM